MEIFKNAFFSIQVLVIIWPDRVMGVCKTTPRIFDSSHNATGRPGPFADGSAIEFTCNPGNTGVGSTYFYCRGSEWAGNFSCVRTCPHVETPQNGLIVGNPAYVVNTTLEFACLDGYTIVGSSSLLCRADGTWRPESPPICKPVSCGDYGSVPNGQVSPINPDGVLNEFGSEVRISCNEGYNVIGYPISTCKSDGTWNTRLQCKISSCGTHPGLKSKCIRHIATPGDGSILSLLCRDNSVNVSVTVVGTGTAFCENNQWDNLDMACFCDCLVDTNSTEGLTYHTLFNKKFVKHGDNLNWECDEGYKKQGLTNTTCNDGQMKTPQCIRVEKIREVPDKYGNNIHYRLIICAMVLYSTYILGFIIFTCKRYKQNQDNAKKPIDQSYEEPLTIELSADLSYPELLIIQSSPDQSDTEPLTMRSSPDQPDIEPLIIQSSLDRSDTEPLTIKSLLDRSDTEPLATHSSPYQSDTEPLTIQSILDKSDTEPSTIQISPDQSDTDTRTIQISPDQSDTNSFTTVLSSPDQSDKEPRTIQISHDQSGTEPRNIQVSPDKSDTDSSITTIPSSPDQSDKEPRTIQISPDQQDTEPRTIQVSPDQSDTESLPIESSLDLAYKETTYHPVMA